MDSFSTGNPSNQPDILDSDSSSSDKMDYDETVHLLDPGPSPSMSSPPESDADPGPSRRVYSEPPRDVIQGGLRKRQAETEGDEAEPDQAIPEWHERHKLRFVEGDTKTKEELKQALVSLQATKDSLEMFKNLIEAYSAKVEDDTPPQQARAVMREEMQEQRIKDEQAARQDLEKTRDEQTQAFHKVEGELSASSTRYDELLGIKVRAYLPTAPSFRVLNKTKNKLTTDIRNLTDTNNETLREKDEEIARLSRELANDHAQTTATDEEKQNATVNKLMSDLSLSSSKYDLLRQSNTTLEEKVRALTNANTHRDSEIRRISHMLHTQEAQSREETNKQEAELKRLTEELSQARNLAQRLERERDEQKNAAKDFESRLSASSSSHSELKVCTRLLITFEFPAEQEQGQLEMRIQNQKAEIEQLSSQTAQFETHEAQSREETNKQEAELKRLTEELSQARNLAQRLERERDEQKNAAKDFESRLSASSSSHNELKGQLEMRIQNQKAEIEQLSSQTAQSERPHGVESPEEIKRLTEELSRAQSRAQRLERERDAQKIAAESFEDRLQAVQSEGHLAAQRLEEVNDKQAEINKLTRELSNVTARYNQQQTRMETLQQTSDDVLEKLSKSKESLQAEYNQAISEQTRLENQVQTLEGEKVNQRQGIVRLEGDKDNLENVVKMLKTQIAQEAEDLKRAQDRVKGLENEKKRLRSDVNELEGKQRHSEEEIASGKRLETRNTVLAQQISQLTDKVTTLKQQMEDSNEEVESLKDERDNLDKSVKEWESKWSTILVSPGHYPTIYALRLVEAEKEELIGKEMTASDSLLASEGRYDASQRKIASLRNDLSSTKLSLQEKQRELDAVNLDLGTHKSRVAERERTITNLRETHGTTVTERDKEISELTDRLTELGTELEMKETEIDTLNGRMEDLKLQVAQRTGDTTAIEQKEAKINELNGVVAQKTKELEESGVNLTGLTTQLESKDTEINVLKGQIKDLDSQLAQRTADTTVIEQKEAKINELNGVVAQKTKELEESGANLTGLTTQLESKDTEINVLKGQIKDLDSQLAQRTADTTAIEQKEAKINELNGSVAQKTKELEESSAKLTGLTTQLESKDTEINVLKGQIKDLDSQLAQRTADTTAIEQKEAKIKKLSEDVSQKSAEISKLNESLKEANNTVAQLKESIDQLKQGKPPPPPKEGMIGQLLETVRDLKKPVTSVNVEAERYRAQQNRPKVSFGGDIPRAPRPTNDGENPWAEPPKDIDALGDDDAPQDEHLGTKPDKTDAESDASFYFRFYTQEQLYPRVPKLTKTAKELNLKLMLRRIILEALPVKNDYLDSIWARAGVSSERLAQFAADPIKHVPKVHNTHLDKRGQTTDDLKNSKWNRALIHRLEKLALDIVEKCRETGHFPEMDDVKFKEFKGILSKRFGEIYRDICASLPRNEEEKENPILIAARLYISKTSRNERNAGVSILRHKFYVRINIIHKMITRSKHDEILTRLWTYALRLTDNLGANGMSDEEKDTQELTTASGVKDKRDIMRILKLSWRHPYFREFYRAIDATPHSENLFGEDNRHNQYPRVLSDKVSAREPPKGLFASVFDDGYMKGLMPYEVANLRLEEDDVQLQDFELNGYRWSSAEPQS
ncbi:hypothetical protein PQX77_020055 [Marasmius sp. AFHP31]|nr:hypothetical protein PQX77_020055 [Marasmius sp. AFHP31]